MALTDERIHTQLGNITIAILFCVGVFSKAEAQDSIPWPSGNHLTVTVKAESAVVHGDNLRIWYALANSASSEQAAQYLAIRAYVPAYRIDGPDRWYASPGMVQDSAAALWTALFS